MTKARGVFWLHLGLAGLGLGVTTLLGIVAARGVSVGAPAGERLLDACRSFVLPHLTVGAGLVLVLGSFAFAVLGLAGRSAWRQFRGCRRFVAALRVLGSASLGPRGAVVFADERPQAFCAGLLRPRIYLSEGALALLGREELDAVLTHELHHARHRDPLRIVFARVLADALFFLPALRTLGARYEQLVELAADAAAVRAAKDPAPLASALLTFDGTVSPMVVGIDPERVDQLAGDRPRWQLPAALLAWALVVVGALLAVAWRTTDTTAHETLNLPLLAAQLCMLTMAVAPLVAGAGVLLGSRRLLHRQRS